MGISGQEKKRAEERLKACRVIGPNEGIGNAVEAVSFDYTFGELRKVLKEGLSEDRTIRVSSERMYEIIADFRKRVELDRTARCREDFRLRVETRRKGRIGDVQRVHMFIGNVHRRVWGIFISHCNTLPSLVYKRREGSLVKGVKDYVRKQV